MARTKVRTIAGGLLGAALLALGAGACSQQIRAEADGRDLADAVCDLKEAPDEAAAEEARQDIADEIDDLIGRYGMATAEDRADIEENLADLAEHAIQGNEALAQQDLAVLQRSAENISEDAGDVQGSAWLGFADGLQECLAD